MGRLSGKVALVTGATRGLGRHHAIALASEGAALALFDGFGNRIRRDAEAEALAALHEVQRSVERCGSRSVVIMGDIRRDADVRKAIDTTVQRLGGLNVMVCNPGIQLAQTPALEKIESTWDLLLDVGLKGQWLACREAVRHMRQEGGGRIILTSSVMAFRGYSGFAEYGAMYAAVVGLAKSLAVELAPLHITVNAVCPSIVEMPALCIDDETEPDPVTIGQALINTQLITTPITPEDVSSAVVWLASQSARYVTGQIIVVDGGALAQR